MIKKLETDIEKILEEARNVGDKHQRAPGLMTRRQQGVLFLQIKDVRRLTNKLENLITTVKKLDKQNQKLEKTNIGLQRAALFLGLFAVFFGAYQLIQSFSVRFLLISLGVTLITGVFVTTWLKKE